MLCCTSCAQIKTQHGYNFNEENVKKVVVGLSDIYQVMSVMGSPTTTSVYGMPKFFYIKHAYSKVPIGNPVISEQDMMVISFNDNGVVSSIDRYDASVMKKDVKISLASTSLPGNEISIISQIIGNIGRYNNVNKMQR